MAIFRAGKLIGNMDIRVGLPRDRSLENVEGDSRIKSEQKIGPNVTTSIGRFMAQINEGEGIARANKFLVRFYPPKDMVFDGADNEFFNGVKMRSNIELMCTSIVLPHRDTLTTNYVTYGPGRKMPYAYNYGTRVECMFMGDKFLRQRAWFEMWQGKMHSLKTHNLQYYDSYAGTMEIFQLGSFRDSDKNAGYDDNYRLTYGVRLHEVYPETIGEIQYQSVVDDMIPMDIPVSFAFRTWENITLDELSGVGHAKATGWMPNIKASKQYGGAIFGKVLGKMPPDMQRAVKTVVGKIKRDIPIGRKTGGRVFPPFEINKVK